MSAERSSSQWLSERRSQALPAVLGITLAVVVYLLVDGKTNLGSLIQGLAISVIFAAGAYLFANYFLFRRKLEPEDVFRQFRAIVQEFRGVVKDRGLRDVVPDVPNVDWGRLLNE